MITLNSHSGRCRHRLDGFTSFKSLPRTHMITAEYDLARNEAHRYDEIPEKNGVHVTNKCYKGMPHAFGQYNYPVRGLTVSHEYIGDTCEMVREVHGL